MKIFGIRQYIEVKEGVTYRVTETDGEKSYKALGEAVEPKLLELVQMVKEEVKVPTEPLNEVKVLRPITDFTNNKDALEEHGLYHGIDLNKRKSIDNMYRDLVNFIEDGI